MNCLKHHRSNSTRERGAARLGVRTGGFTLVEIMIAIAIIALVTVVLLDRRTRAVQEASKIKDQRLAWTLAAWKMSSLELDEKLLTSDAMLQTDAGTFDEYAADYNGYTWEYEAKREEIKVYDELEVVEKPRELIRVTLRVKRPDAPEPLMELQAMMRPKVDPPPEAPK